MARRNRPSGRGGRPSKTRWDERREEKRRREEEEKKRNREGTKNNNMAVAIFVGLFLGTILVFLLMGWPIP